MGWDHRQIVYIKNEDTPRRSGRADQPAGGLCARWPFNAGRNPSGERRDRRNLVAREMFCHGHSHSKGWRRRSVDAAASTGTTDSAGRMIFGDTVVTRHSVMRATAGSMSWPYRKLCPGLVADIHAIVALAWTNCKHHGARRFDRKNASLHRQRKDQYPYNEDVDKRTHASHSTHAR